MSHAFPMPKRWAANSPKTSREASLMQQLLVLYIEQKIHPGVSGP